VSFRDALGLLTIFGLPALFVVGWAAAWIFLRRAPLWGFAVASVLSAASIVLAWAVSAASPPAAGQGEHRAIAFYALFINGVGGLLCVGLLAIATAVIGLVRMGVGPGTPEADDPKDPVLPAHQA
jgi:hypothetical protein